MYASSFIKKSLRRACATLLAILLLMNGMPSQLQAQAPALGDDDLNWIASNIIPPSTNLMFQLNVSGSLLRIDEKYEKKTPPVLPESVEALTAFIAENPLEVSAYKKRFQILGQTTDRQTAISSLQEGLDRYLTEMDAHPADFDLALRAHEFFYLVGEPDKVIILSQRFLENNPKHAEALSFLAMQLALRGEVQAAREHIDRAYAADPLMEDIYVAEWMYQWVRGMIRLNETGEMELSKDLEFLNNAIERHSESTAPLLSLHALSVTQALTQGVFHHSEAFEEQVAFSFELLPDTKTKLKAARKYFEKQLKAKPVHPYFLQKCLALACILDNDMKSADKIYQQTPAAEMTDTDIHRIMTVGAITQADFSLAARYTQESFAVNPTQDNLLLYARLLSDGGDPKAAVEAILGAEGAGGLEVEFALAAYLIMNGDWQIAARRMEQFPSGFGESAEPDYRYLRGVINLCMGDRDGAQTFLVPMKDQDHYGPNVQKIMEKFDLK